MNINKDYIKTAIDEFEKVQKAVDKLQGHNFSYVLNRINNEVYGNTHNYDGELFDFCLSRILGTIKKGKGRTAILDRYIMFDISDDLSGEWIDANIDELKALLPPKQVCCVCGCDVYVGVNGNFIDYDVVCEKCKKEGN